MLAFAKVDFGGRSTCRGLRGGGVGPRRRRRHDDPVPRPTGAAAELPRNNLLDAGLAGVRDLITGPTATRSASRAGSRSARSSAGARGADRHRQYGGAMRVEGFTAKADIVGRRRLTWQFALDQGDRAAAAGSRSAASCATSSSPPPARRPLPRLRQRPTFLPGGTSVTEVDLGEAVERGARTVATAESVAREIDGVPCGRGARRRTRTVTFDAARNPVGYLEEILDVEDRATGLDPGTPYYYELVGDALPGDDPDAFRAVAVPTEVHRSGRSALRPAAGDRPPPRRHEGPGARHGRHPGGRARERPAAAVRRSLGPGFDHLRSRAAGLRGLHDVDSVDYRLLPHLAAWLGWDLSYGKPIPIQRHEYQVRGPPVPDHRDGAGHRDLGQAPDRVGRAGQGVLAQRPVQQRPRQPRRPERPRLPERRHRRPGPAREDRHGGRRARLRLRSRHRPGRLGTR